MSTFNLDQALARCSELHEKRGQEIDRRPDRRAHNGSRPLRFYGCC